MAASPRPSVPLSLAFRLILRDLRSGEVIVLVLALVVAVAAMSAVIFFTDRVRQAVAEGAGEALAGDLRLESGDPLPPAFGEQARDEGLDTAEVIHFNSVVLAGESSSLADVRGVSAAYPLRGEIRIADALAAAPRSVEGVPAAGNVWAEPALLARLGLDVGDEIDIGRLRLRVERSLEFRPDEGWRMFELAPTVLLNLSDILASGLLQPGSIAEYQLLVAGSRERVARFREAIEPALTPTQELSDVRNGRPEVTSAIDRAERFLVLAAMVSVLLGGVAVAMAARRFVARRLDSVALMKCIGASVADILRLIVGQLLVLVAIATVGGLVAGYVAQFGLTALLADLIEVELPLPGLTGVYLAPATAFVVAMGFALPPLLALRRVSPMRVLRQDLAPAGPGLLTIYAAAAFALGGLLYAMFGDVELILYVTAGAAAMLAVLYLAGRLLVWLLKGMRSRVGVAWRYGLANVARRGRESGVQVMAFGLGLMVLLLLGVLRTGLMQEWQDLLPEAAANQFMINIQPGEPDAIAGLMTSRGLDAPEFTPLLRASISDINGRPLAEYRAPNRWAQRELEEELNLTWLAEIGDDNKVIAGEWWDSAGGGAAQMSIEQSLAERTGLDLGDRVSFLVGGESLEVTITSIRSVRWETFRPNFFMVLNPGSAEQYAHTYISSLRVEASERGILLELARAFPAVSVIDIGALIDQVRRAMSRATLAVQYVFLFTLAAGVMVLLAAIQATRDERVFESAVLRTLGAGQGIVLKGLAAEFVALGLLAGSIGAAGAGSLAWLIATRVFEIDYLPEAGLLLLGALCGASIVGLSGTLALRKVVTTPPLASLRGL
jgi:putative ABC transport system permease protein